MSVALDEGSGTGVRSLRRYPAYRDSGADWLGDIPEHWQAAPVYARYEVALGKMLDGKRSTGVAPGRYVANANVQWDRVSVGDLSQMDFAPRERDRYRLRPGDLLVCEGGEVGRTAIWRGEVEDCFYQKAVHRVRPRADNELPRFFFYLMHAFAKQGVFVAGGNPNTIDHLTAVQLKHYRFPFPPSAEQGAIVQYLDRETAKIDALLAVQERVIDLLQEKRTALINRAVMKGLDPTVDSSKTGSALFPEIPLGWRSTKLRRLIRRIKRPVRVELGAQYREIGTRSWGKGIFHKEPITGAQMEEKSIFYIKSGDLILNIVFAWEGAVAIASEHEEGMVASHRFPTFRVIDGHADLDYLLMFLQSEQGRALMGLNSPGAAGRNRTIRLDTFVGEEIPLPPVEVQREIVTSFRAREHAFRAVETRARELIDRLDELRTALISAAVTGKIDVREEPAA